MSRNYLFILATASLLALSCSSDPVPDTGDVGNDNGDDASQTEHNDLGNNTADDVATPQPDATPQQPDVAEPEPEPEPDAHVADVSEEPDVEEPSNEGGCLNDDCTLHVLVLGEDVGSTASGVFSQDSTDLRNRPAGVGGTDTEECRVSGPFPVKTYYAFVEVRNTTTEDATVDLKIDTAPPEYDGAIYAYSHLAAYAAVPTTDAEADDCLTGVNRQCPDLSDVSAEWPCLIGAFAPVVPASGSIWVYLGLHSTPNQPAGEVPVSFELRATRR